MYIARHINKDSKLVEQEVLHILLKYLNLDESSYYGYITTGGTEGNMYSMLQYRYFFQMKHNDKPKYYFSRRSHYSIEKICKILDVPYSIIDENENFEINTDHLSHLVNQDIKSGIKSGVIILTYGKTETGSIDDVLLVKSKLPSTFDFKIHLDAAIYGLLIPYKNEHNIIASCDSFSMSGHKLFGSIFVYGFVFYRKENLIDVKNKISYTNLNDETIVGSRNGYFAIDALNIIKEYEFEKFYDANYMCKLRKKFNCCFKNMV